jgi:hypothetical protein
LGLGFTEDAAKYLTSNGGLRSLDEVTYLDGDDDMENLINHVNHGGTITATTGAAAVTSPQDGHDVTIKAESNLKHCVFYLKHQKILSRKPTVGLIDHDLVHSFHHQQKWEDNFNKTAVEPVISDKDWPWTLENISEL